MEQYTCHQNNHTTSYLRGGVGVGGAVGEEMCERYRGVWGVIVGWDV